LWIFITSSIVWSRAFWIDKLSSKRNGNDGRKYERIQKIGMKASFLKYGSSKLD
jgi:hypothetical protein